jgi:hypothetical protein
MAGRQRGFSAAYGRTAEIDPPGEAMPLIVRGQMYGCLDLTEMDTLHRDEVDAVLAESARARSSPQARRATSPRTSGEPG